MPIVDLDFGTNSNPGEFGHDGGARHINARVEDATVEGKRRRIIKSAPGLKPFAFIPGGGGCRGLFTVGATLYAVSGNILVPVDAAGGVGAQLGGVPGDGPLAIARNRKTPDNQVALVSEGNKLLLENNMLKSIADTDLPPPVHVVFVDGYFIFVLPDGRFFLSGIDLGDQIAALDFATAEGRPDGLVGAGVRARELFLIGEETTEVWQNTGAAAFPFERLPGVFIETGCAARHTIRSFAGSLSWVANRTDQEPYRVILLDGYAPLRISTHAVERAIEDLDDKDDMKAFTFAENGHLSYALTSRHWTWVYDAVTGQWHERVSQNRPNWRALWAVPFAGEIVLGDATSNELYTLDRNTYEEAGRALIWRIRSPISHAYPHRLRIHRFFADLIPGAGLNSTDAAKADPKVMLRYSEDGGASWSAERQLSVGRIARRKTRVKTHRLGVTGEDGRIWELSMSAAVARAWTGSALDVERLEP